MILKFQNDSQLKRQYGVLVNRYLCNIHLWFFVSLSPYNNSKDAEILLQKSTCYSHRQENSLNVCLHFSFQ